MHADPWNEVHQSFQGGREPGAHDRILIVDDEPDIRETLASVLKNAFQDLEILTAANAQEGLLALQGGGIQLILSDYRMPGEDGLTFLQEARRLDPHVPRILMTAFEELDVAKRAINEAQVNHFLSKPFAPNEVIDVVWEAMDAHWHETEPSQHRSGHS